MIQKLLSLSVLFVALQINAQNGKLSGYISEPFSKEYSTLPVKVSRTLSFRTDEASWIDVDISPDGRVLLFTILGDLYTMPASGGIAKQVTKGLAINRCPVWSPDGKYIAYISDATGFIRLHIADTSRKFHKVLGNDKDQLNTGSLKITWFPDSEHLVVGNNVYDLTGEVSPVQQEIKRTLSFSSDGKFMYSLQEISSDSSAIIKFNRLTGDKNNLLVYKQPWYSFNLNNVRISPDGNWLTYLKYKTYDAFNGNSSPADSLMIIDLNTGKEKLLAHLGIKFTGYLHNQNYSFTKDSRYLFIGYGGKIHRIEISSGKKNEIIPFTANVNVDMGPLNYNTFPISLDSLEVKYIRSARKRPESKQIVFSALNKLYVQDLPNGKPRILVDQPFGQFQPTYSPDGKWIIYISWIDAVGGHIWKVSSNGGNPEQITSKAGLYLHPSWSPDGKKIVVAIGANKLSESGYLAKAEIQLINLEDKTIKTIADKAALYNNPNFYKGANKIVFKPDQNQSNNKVRSKLVLFDLITGAKNELVQANNEEGRYPIRHILLSPDGRYLVLTYNDNLYLSSIANIGGSQMIMDEESPTTLIRFARGGIDPVWENNGKVLSWVAGNQYCSINPDKILAAAKHLNPNSTLEGLPKTKIIDVDIPADQTISIHLKVPRLYGTGLIALTNVRIITMHNNHLIENGTVIMKDGRFVSVGESKKISIPKEATVFDLAGKTIMPGLIDMHSHMSDTRIPDVFPQQSWKRLQNLSFGVTTLRCPSGSFDLFGYEELIETGQMLSSRPFQVGDRVDAGYNLTSLTEGCVIINNRKKMGATVIKQYQQPTRLQRQLLLLACSQAGVNMTNEGDKDPLYSIGQVKDGSSGVEHNPTWGEVYKDVITFMAKSGTYFCPTLQISTPEARGFFLKRYGKEYIDKSSRFMPEDYKKWQLKVIDEQKLDSGFLLQSKIDARIKHAGGKIVMGSHGEDQGIGAHWEIWALQMGGLTNYEALETATITAAEALGMQKDLGSIEVGKIADLIILDKNPLEDIRNTNTIKYVMKAGVLYESETLDQIWPNKVKCPEWRMKEVKSEASNVKE